jgi:hypothetical protein
LGGIWGSSPSDVFAVGGLNGQGIILHYDGSSWSPMTGGTIAELYSVWGSSSRDVFAVGMNGTILHYDGSTWSKMESGTGNYLQGMWGSCSSDVFAAGDWGTILHYSQPAPPAPGGLSAAAIVGIAVGACAAAGLIIYTIVRIRRPAS